MSPPAHDPQSDEPADCSPAPAWAPADWAVAAILALFVAIALWLSPVRHISDSAFSLLLSDTLLRRRTFVLDEFFRDYAHPDHPGPPRDTAYQLERTHGHIYYHYPPGSSVLSIPYVAVMRLAGYPIVTPEGVYDWPRAHPLQGLLAALLMAATACLFYASARLLLPASWALGLALCMIFGTQIWSTASRVLWNHSWGIVLMAVAIDRLLRVHARGAPLRPVLLATLLAWSYMVRPVYSVPILCVTVYIFALHGRAFPVFAATGAAWAALFAGWSLYHFGTLLPSYYTKNRLSLVPQWESLLGTLVSPSRGLIPYVPLVLVIAWLCWRYRGWLAHRPLAWLAGGVVAVTILALGSWWNWWGGYSYGARLTTDLVPWFFLLALLGLHALRRHEPAGLRSISPAKRAIAVLLILASVAINGAGALVEATWEWNRVPVSIEKDLDRLWDWHRPQMFAGLYELQATR